MLKRSTSLTERWQFLCDGSVISVATTPNCSLVAAATVGRSLYLLNAEGELVWLKSPEHKETGLDHEGWSTAISADGNLIAVGTANKNPADGTVYLYNSRGEQVFAENLGAPVWSVSLSEDGGTLAAGCWNGNAYRFARTRAGYELADCYSSGINTGLYGLRVNRDGTRAYICAYNTSIIVLDETWQEIGRSNCPDGLYNIALAEDGGIAVAGLRDGKVLRLHFSDLTAGQLQIHGCGRPVCGVATSRWGDLVAAGSFDGWVYVIGETGIPFGKFETRGEVWSVACSEDAALICSGSGDNTVRMFENVCSSAPAREISLFEKAVQTGAETESSLRRLVHAYAQYGLFEYGYITLRQFRHDAVDPLIFMNASDQLLNTAVGVCDSTYWAHYELGLRAQHLKKHREAIVHFQKAAQHPDYISRAMTHCADSFTAKHLPAATAACYRRARERQIDSETKRVLYHLGRSYEDTKQWHQAISHFQLLTSWDINYLNTWSRLEHLISIHGNVHSEETPRRADYTGKTINLLGPDAPRDVDENLEGVLQARTAEVLIESGERERVSAIIKTLRNNERFCRGISGTGLEYDQELFLKYDYALPEDETKKFLETVNLLYLLAGNKPRSSLDIGSATGRYPTLLKWLGADAWGLDIEPRAVAYAKSQLESSDEWPKYVVGDACDLPFRQPTFDLITCMMGTFAHISHSEHLHVLSQAFAALRPGGHLAISTWDMECKHLAYLSIYNEKQKDTIRANSPSGASMKAQLECSGFVDLQIRPFCLLPEIVVYDLGIENLRSGDIDLAAQADLAVRSLYPEKHGEMFLAFGRKPNTKSNHE